MGYPKGTILELNTLIPFDFYCITYLESHNDETFKLEYDFIISERTEVFLKNVN